MPHKLRIAVTTGEIARNVEQAARETGGAKSHVLAYDKKVAEYAVSRKAA
jgi:hypothetical protein